MNRVLIGIIVPITVAIITGIFLLTNTLLMSRTTPPTPTPVGTTSLVTPTPTLYHVDFSQGWQRWSGSTQWMFRDNMLVGDGSPPCCNPSNIAKIAIVAPYHPQTSDYAVEAKIRVVGINTNQQINDNIQPPYFGLYVRGNGVNHRGYEVGILGRPIDEPNSLGATPFLTILDDRLPGGHKYKPQADPGTYPLDSEWHTYRVEVQGNKINLKVDNISVFPAPVQDDTFQDGPLVGLEDYACLLQTRSFTVSQL